MKTLRTSHKPFAIAFAACFALTLLAVAVTNLAVDPYNIFRVVRIRGFNEKKGQATDNTRLCAAYDVRRVKPRSIILGSSRTMRQLYCNHPGWDPRAKPCYNLSIPLSNAYENLRYFQHANQVAPLKEVVYGLDFYSFNSNMGNLLGFEEDRLAARADGTPNFYPAKDLFSAIISVDAFKDSIITVSRQRDKTYNAILPNDPPADGIPPEFFVFNKHPQQYFRGQLMGVVTTGYARPGGYRYSLYAKGGKKSMLDSLREMVSIARRDGVQLRLFISPEHAQLEEAAAMLGLWPVFEQWKRELVKIAGDDGKNNPVQLWDFSGYNSITTDPPPTAESERTSRRFWDSHHYKKEVGDMILSRVFGVQDTGVRIPGDFGTRLTSRNIERRLKHIRDDQRLYRQTHSAELKDLEKFIVKNTRGFIAESKDYILP